jgi:hypothetical protein
MPNTPSRKIAKCGFEDCPNLHEVYRHNYEWKPKYCQECIEAKIWRSGYASSNRRRILKDLKA